MLLDLYQQKLDLFQHLAKLSESMSTFTPDQLIDDDAEAGDMFTRLLDERAVLILRIDDLTEQIRAQERKEESGQAVERIKASLAEEIVKIQSQSVILETLVERSLGKLRDEARKLQSGKKSNRAYIGSVPSVEGSFIDKKR